ncbi:hypothetical protein B0H13DRAFT_2055902 [Mycena leptocephala]|nr:hypothetical protein B0H13DRAFT_2055902 [Mycena leptocephala]
MVELIQTIYYFRHFKGDDWKLKTRVAVAFTIDTVSFLGNYTCVYLYVITHAGDPAYLAKQNWPMPLYIFGAAIVAALVQSFLVGRYWRLTRNIIMTLSMDLLILLAFGGTFTTAMVVILFPGFEDRAKVKIPGIIWTTTQAVVDLLIAVALLWEFRKLKPGVKETQSLLNRLAARTIQTGTLSAAIAVTAQMMYLVNSKSNVTVAIGFCIGRVYVLTLLSNLNIRQTKSTSIKGISTDEDTGTGDGTRMALELSESGVANRCSIQFYLTDIIIDSGQEFPLEQFKSKSSPAQSRANDSSPVEIEMTTNYSSKQKSESFAT